MTVKASCMYKNEMSVGKPLLISLGYYQDMHDPFNLCFFFLVNINNGRIISTMA